MSAPPLHVPLWCKSHYSFLEGASSPGELVETAQQLGLPALALTDRDGVYGVVRAHMRAKELGLPLRIGAELTVADGSRIVLLVADRRGYAHLCRLITAGRRRSPKGESRVEWAEVCAHAPGLLALWGGENSRLAEAGGVESVAAPLREAFGDRLYALLARHRRPGDAFRERRLRARAAHYGLPLVAATEVLYHAPPRRRLQDVLTCIRHGVTLATAGRRIRANAEHGLRAPQDFARLYADVPQALARTLEVAARCPFSLTELRYRYPSERLPDGTTSAQRLQQLTLDGARARYPAGVPAAVRRQLEKELGLVRELEYDGYFLTMWEIVRFCREQGILCQGRGSAANSAVCYCLGITAIDPVRMGLLFERFLSKERAEPPDIDLDIEHDRREEVIQHVYAKYGRSHAAMVANFIRYRARSAVRDVGKVLGMPATELDRLARLVSPYGPPVPEESSAAGFDPGLRLHQDLLQLVAEIEDVPRHLSIHPGGFLLGHEPVHDLVPIENAAMAGRTVIQWDKHDVEDLGLFKVDLLGLGALNLVHRCFDLIVEHGGPPWSLAAIPPRDEPTFRMIRAADTVGVFQIESRAQIAMLPRLRPRDYYDLVIEISLVRPGPITGGMVHPYLRRRTGEEAVTYPHPSLEPILKKTLGIPLFQEQVMQLAVVAADYTPGEADQLRRDMAAWRKQGRIERHRERLISRMQRKGIAPEFAERVFEQIRGFGEYGFPESHAASFALIAYATAWLKCHHPAAFLCALLNAQPMGFYSPAALVGDARRHQVEVRCIDVRYSAWECRLEPAAGGGEGFAVRMGLRFVKGLAVDDAERIAAAREKEGFASVQDCADRAALGEGALARLAESGAFESLHAHRREALWTALGVVREEGSRLPLEHREPAARFAALSDFETIHWDYEFTGHSPRGHPLEPLRRELTRMGLPDATAVAAMEDGSMVDYAGIVLCRQRPSTANGTTFMTLEDETGYVNLVVWERVWNEFHVVAKTTNFLGASGRLQVQAGVVHLVAESLWAPALGRRPHSARSRDFR
ncbi:MAG TPA: error-prone DNA polymerase [Planctomycetota bacterium]